ncbi:MAG TPA: polysaccharide biosynthesis/export family protein [Ottowia sp.]|uniref:polysaccharide biosynthesis/export family protein n=1 Tax=Ottowia sp. TaxID=1898956 RepID=UPI002C0DE463|nr:polysaccharide biosynthesis/export family protein [Ottowia sp.]HMN20909.1 polysaccharide biosynthesis/export family protein [Ottowia sp.]
MLSGMALAQTAAVAPLAATAAMHAPVTQVSAATQTAAVQPSGGGYAAGGAPVAAAPGDALSEARPATIDTDYRIGSNDLLEIEVFGVEELKRTVRVNSGGQVSLPLIGMIPVAGLSPADAEALIEQRYGEKYLQDPQVSIFIKEFTSQRITVDGAVARPGIYPLTGQITLLRALAMAGGGGALANLEEVMLFRLGADGQALTEKHDVMKIRTGEAPDPLLQGDDVVVVNRNGARAALRDSLFSDIIGTLNPFSSIYRNAATP